MAVIDLSSTAPMVPLPSHEQEDAMAFEPGDVVFLKSGGQPMTVAAIDEDNVECLWIGEEGELFRETVPAVVLTAAPDEDDEDDDDEEEKEDEEDTDHEEADADGDKPAKGRQRTA